MLYVAKHLMKKDTHLQSIMTINPERFEVSFALTAIGTSSDGTGTRTYFTGWLDT